MPTRLRRTFPGSRCRINRKLFLLVTVCFMSCWMLITLLHFYELPIGFIFLANEEVDSKGVTSPTTPSAKPAALHLQGESNKQESNGVFIKEEPPIVKEETPIVVKEPPIFAPMLERSRNQSLVIYNRVPKCGSTTMYILIRNSSFLLNYNFTNNNTFRPSLNEPQQNEFTARLGRIPSPWVYLSHVYFVNFEKFNRSTPAYINIIRDPIDRFASHYYCCYAPKRNNKPVQTLDQCVAKKSAMCTNKASSHWNLVVNYFCGQDPICRRSSPAALELAKHNIEKYYTLVGTLEDLPKYHQLLEFFLPQFFKGVNNMYQKNSPKYNSSNDPRKESVLSDESRAMLKTMLALEYELYNFVTERLYNLHKHYKDNLLL